MIAKKSILLVEDNPDDIELTLRAFRKNNILNEIAIARDGAEALDYLLGTDEDNKRSLTQLPSVVLLDLKIPKIDGLTVLRQVRLHQPTQFLPVVILTSSTEERDLVQSYRLGANSYVRKPVNFHEFLAAAQSLGLYWLLINKTPYEKGAKP